jgi:hypothetical protein
MFQEGGAATIDPDLFFIDKIKGEKKFINRDVLLKNLVEDASGQTIAALVQVPTSEIEYSPKAQELLRQVVAQVQSGYSGVDPNTFRFGERLPAGLYYGETAGRVASLAGDYGAQAAEGLFNIGRSLFSGAGRGGASREDAGPVDIFPSERFPFDPESRGGQTKASRAGLLREGIPQADLVTTLSRAQVGDVITDFAPEIEEITETTEEAVPSFDFRDDDIRSKVESAEMFREQQRRERLEREAEQRAADASPILSDTLGTIDPDDAAARKSAFLESVIGMDEFGEPIPGFDERTGFTEDGLAIAKAIDDLTPIENKVDIDRTEADSLMDIENKFSPTFEPPEPSIDKVDTTITAEMVKESEERDKRKPKEFSDKTKGQFREVFGSDRFLDFIRNVGGELVRTGQLGEGLASGAAKAAEERATRDLLAEQEAKKFEREKQLLMTKELLEGSEGLNASELNTLMKNVDELSENVMNYEGTEASIAIMNDAIALFDEAIEKGVPVTGLPGRIMRFKDEAAAFLGIDNPNVSDATKIQNYIEQVKQRSIREILNESGRTISNLDREIVDNVFGGLDLTGDPKEIRKKLDNARANLIKNNRDKQRKITSDYTTLQDPEFKGKGIAAIKPYEDLILKIIGLDPSAVTRAAAQSADVNIAEITL